MQKDIDFKLRKFSTSRNVILKQDESALIQIFEHIMLTRKGERPFDSNFGTSIEDFKGMPVNMVDAIIIRNMIINAVNNYLNDVEISEDNVNIEIDMKSGIYNVDVNYYDKENIEQNINFEFLWRT